MDHSSRSADLGSPVVVLTGARSGSTLLRLLLDAHPDLACPAETSILRTCSQLASSWEVVYSAGFSASDRERMNSAIRQMLDGLYGPYLAGRGKTRWCDKSLGTAMIADSFVDLYPGAKFLCLYRHAMDVIYSAIEASPWGMIGYGLDRFAALSAGNNICAAASYWVEQVSQILAFERRHPERCIRINYERLVKYPEAVADQIFAFLDLKPSPGISEQCFGDVLSMGDGPGDHKITSTRSVTTKSIGRGFRIPLDRIPSPQLNVMNTLLQELGYTPVDDRWRRAAYPPEPLTTAERQGPGSPEPGRFLQTVERAITGLLQAAHNSTVRNRRQTTTRQRNGENPESLTIVAYSASLPRTVRSWHLEVTGTAVTEVTVSGDQPLSADWTISGDHEAWLSVLSGQLSIAVSMRDGSLRYIGGRGEAEGGGPSQARDRLAVLGSILGIDATGEEAAVQDEDL